MTERIFFKARETSHTGECVEVAPPVDDSLQDNSDASVSQCTEVDPAHDTDVIFGDTKLHGHESEMQLPVNPAAFVLFAAGLKSPDQWPPVQ